MLLEAVLKDKIPTQFSRRTRAAQARSSDSINQIQLQEVHSDITRQAWETSQKLAPLSLPTERTSMDLSHLSVRWAHKLWVVVTLSTSLQWSKASASTAMRNLAHLLAKLSLTRETPRVVDPASRMFIKDWENIKVATAKLASLRRYSRAKKMAYQIKLLEVHPRSSKKLPLLLDKI